MKLSLRRALKFWTVGGVGAVIQAAVFYVLTRNAGLPDFITIGNFLEVPWALGWSIVLAAMSNYVLNELWTWREFPEAGAATAASEDRSPAGTGSQARAE